MMASARGQGWGKKSRVSSSQLCLHVRGTNMADSARGQFTGHVGENQEYTVCVQATFLKNRYNCMSHMEKVNVVCWLGPPFIYLKDYSF